MLADEFDPMLIEAFRAIQEVAELVARRAGRRPDEFVIRNLAGAVIGVSMTVMLTAAEDPTADQIALIDAGFAHLEAALPV